LESDVAFSEREFVMPNDTFAAGPDGGSPQRPLAGASVAPLVHSFFDEDTFTITYVVEDESTKRCAIIDSVLDYSPAAGSVSTASADRVVALTRERGLTVEWILETHVHADHLSAAPYLKEKLGGEIGIGAHVTEVQRTFARIFNTEPEFVPDGGQFDRLFNDGDVFSVGSIPARAMHTPGHTPACMTFIIGDAAFVGDTLFMPDQGAGRCDFPGGDARQMHRSIQRVYSLPPKTRLFMGHDYKAPGRDHYAWESTVEEERLHNVQASASVSEDAFVAMRTQRDASLKAPRLIIPSIQVNMRAGRMPPPEDNGVTYLKIPLNLF
jgi:glyoxylase-like metal-dependent hydrolase (beta-lactamase superfamily II)